MSRRMDFEDPGDRDSTSHHTSYCKKDHVLSTKNRQLESPRSPPIYDNCRSKDGLGVGH